MRLAAKLILLFLVGLLLIVGVFSYLTIQQDRQIAAAEHEQQAADLVSDMRPQLKDAVVEGDTGELQRVLSQSSRPLSRFRIRWVQLDRRSDSSTRPNVPLDLIVTKREVTTVTMPDRQGREMLYTYVPVEEDDESAGTIEISAPNDEPGERMRGSITRSGIALAGVTLLSALVILIGGIWMVGRPLEKLIDKVHRVGKGDFSEPLHLTGRDELGKLAFAVNEMCDQLDRQRQTINEETASRISAVQQLRHVDRLGTVGRLAAGVAHELGTPLNVVSGRTELIAGGKLSGEDAKHSATIIKGEVDRISSIIRELLDFARRGTPIRASVDLRDIVSQTVALMQSIADKKNVRILIDRLDEPMSVKADSAQIQQVFTNLIDNAIGSMDSGGSLRIAFASEQLVPPDGVAGDQESLYRCVRFVDSGHGICEDDLEHVFEPFFTTKDVGEGTGLGLSIAYGIMRDHDGWIHVASELGRGSRFSVYVTAD